MGTGQAIVCKTRKVRKQLFHKPWQMSPLPCQENVNRVEIYCFNASHSILFPHLSSIHAKLKPGLTLSLENGVKTDFSN